ncbi:outer membrane protein assembly factor BamB family protein [Stieleria varia]|uniref:Pyrrolo-quinoline quinone repeat domain-containing protein n=1 Tax=Stieleria varia TaxID=2528005 RepID=A0A5C6AG94_9BACT|nr:PQQ-binding-like beta-propeller repeat protein [Stieleria varia]TWT98447.1 hypothetical protein Pla52n_49610 [Stieleria varia]
MKRTLALLILFFLVACDVIAQTWPQAAGPSGDFVADGSAVSDFSVSLDKNVLWTTPLPSTGQGTPVVVDGKVFLTSHAAISADSETGSDILGMCFDAKTGVELWRREIPGTRETDLSSLFSDNTAASPVATEHAVCFINVGGTLVTFDLDGNELWRSVWTPFGRHHARGHEPMLHDGHVILMHVPRTDLPISATTKAGAQPLGTDYELWTRLQAYDLATGKRSWIADAGTSVHCTSILQTLPNGHHAILTGRGGGHQPPEKPYGLSLIDASNGHSIWDREIPGYAAHQNVCWDGRRIACMIGSEHCTLDAMTGKEILRASLLDNVSICRHIDGHYVTQHNQSLSATKQRARGITYQTNCLVGDYHYFLAHHDHLVGRVNVQSGKVEYLQVPVQVIRNPGKSDELLWDKALPNDMKNADGFLATQDKRNAGSGWGHVSAASPIVVGDLIYMPTMVGTVYVLRWNADDLNADALVSISDLGPAGETWSLSSLAYADGRLYARTLKQLICIGLE